jgi:choline dehydrogenase-like flavoprotein
MTFLTDSERRTLHIICDTLIPSLAPDDEDSPVLFRTSAADLGIAEKVEIALERATSSSEQLQVKLALRAFNNGFVNGVLAGHWAPLEDMPHAAREELLFALATSRYETSRKLFLTFKRLASFLFYAIMPEGKPNPVWEGLGYVLPIHVDSTSRPIQPYMIHQSTVLETDVLVIGSGAGGGVIAGELAQAGHEVIVIEKGGYYADHEVPRDELSSMETMYEKYGALVTEDTAISVLAGSTLGGGTVVNWSASFRTPENVLYEWEKVLGFSGATGQALQQSFDAVSTRINVNTAESIANPNNQVLERGAKALGYGCDVVARNVKGCDTCDFCCFGCQFGAKQSTTKTYLQDAYVRAHVDRILHERGQVRGAVVTVQGADGHVHNLTVKAKTVVVCAGTIHTPAILLRSGLKNPNIGANLRLHPTTVVTGLFPELIEPWKGAPLTRVVRDFKNLDGNGYGIWLENAPAHPGLNGLANPWTSARQHKRVIQQFPHTANIIVLTRDRDSGRIKLSSTGQPIMEYRLSPYDANHLMIGLQQALKIHVAAGALEIAAPYNDRPSFVVGKNGSLEAYLAKLKARGLRPNDFALFSAHQMSSARIGGDSARGAVDPTGQSWEVKGLYVADGSALPNAPGVNPMLTIMAVAHYIAQHIK